MTTIAFRQFSANFPTQIASTFYFLPTPIPAQQKIKRACNPAHGFSADTRETLELPSINAGSRASDNSKLAIAAVSALIWKFVFLL